MTVTSSPALAEFATVASLGGPYGEFGYLYFGDGPFGGLDCGLGAFASTPTFATFASSPALASFDTPEPTLV